MKKLLLFFFLLVIVVIFLCILSCSFTKKAYIFRHDPRLSLDSCQMIEDFFYQSLFARCRDTYVVKKICNQFPFIETITLEHTPLNSFVTTTIDDVLCIVNETHVLMQSGRLYSISFFNLSADMDVATVFTDSMDENISLIPSFLHCMPQDFHKIYDVRIENEYYVKISDKNQKNFFIICAMNQSNLPDILMRCKAIFANVYNDQKYKNKKMFLDARFADYIIAYGG